MLRVGIAGLKRRESGSLLLRRIAQRRLLYDGERLISSRKLLQILNILRVRRNTAACALRRSGWTGQTFRVMRW